MKSLCFTTEQGNYTYQQIEISRDQIKFCQIQYKLIILKLK